MTRDLRDVIGLHFLYRLLVILAGIVMACVRRAGGMRTIAARGPPNSLEDFIARKFLPQRHETSSQPRDWEKRLGRRMPFAPNSSEQITRETNLCSPHFDARPISRDANSARRQSIESFSSAPCLVNIFVAQATLTREH